MGKIKDRIVALTTAVVLAGVTATGVILLDVDVTSSDTIVSFSDGLEKFAKNT